MKLILKPEDKDNYDYICVNDIHLFPLFRSSIFNKKYIRYSTLNDYKSFNSSGDDVQELEKEGYIVIKNPLYNMTLEEICDELKKLDENYDLVIDPESFPNTDFIFYHIRKVKK